MVTGWTETMLTHQALPGISARLVDSCYMPGGQAAKREEGIELRLRLSSGTSRITAGRLGGALNSTGRLMCIPPNTETYAVSDAAQNIRSLSLKIDPRWIEHVIGEKNRAFFDGELLNFNFHNDHIHRAMHKISAEIISPNEFSIAVIDACCRLIFIELFRASANGKGANEQPRELIVRERIKAIENFVYDFGDGCPTLADVAQELNLGASYVRQIYKKVMHRTLFDFIQEVRIARAQSFLAESNLSLKTISYKLGYYTPSAFSVAFRKVTGLTPREYRARTSRDVRLQQDASLLASRSARG